MSDDDKPQRAIILARISDDRDGKEEGVGRQKSDSRKLADMLGWTVGPEATHVITENSVSAYARRKVCRGCLKPVRQCECRDKHESVMRTYRPELRRVLQMLKSGEADALICYHLDRVFRDMRDLEDLIDVVREQELYGRVKAFTGSLHFDSPSDVTNMRIGVAIASGSSDDTARRVARAREDRAKAGRFGGGVRPFGFEPDGVTVREAEAAEIRDWADKLLKGISLFAITTSLNERKLLTVKARAWRTAAVRETLLSPRVAGLAVHQVEAKARKLRKAGQPVPYDVGVVGKGQWPAILPEETWRAVAGLLSDPSRRTSPHSHVRWLGSLIYKCGVCAEAGVDSTVSVGTVLNGQGPAYRCRAHTGHIRRAQAPVDDFVTELVIRRLAMPDAIGLFAPQVPEVDRAGLHAEAAVLRERANQLAAAFAAGTVTAAQLSAGSEVLNKRLTEIDAELAASVVSSPLDGIPLGTEDVAAAWAKLSLVKRRTIVKTLVEVTLDRGRPGRAPLTPEYKQHREGCEACKRASSVRKWNEGCEVGVALHRSAYICTDGIHVKWL